MVDTIKNKISLKNHSFRLGLLFFAFLILALGTLCLLQIQKEQQTPPAKKIPLVLSINEKRGEAKVLGEVLAATGVTRVEFLIDGELKHTDTTAPYTFSWDTTTVPNGSHTVSAKAFDGAGNEGGDSVPVNVNNPVCTRANPSVSLTPSSQSGDPGTVLDYTFTVTNQDSSGCGSSTFSLSGTIPSGWSSSFTPSSLSLSPSASGTSSFRVTSSASAAAGSYTVTAQATNSSDTGFNASDSSTYVVDDVVAPSVPSGLTATSISHDQVDLSWNASSDNVEVVGYNVIRDGVAIDTSLTTSFSDTTVSPETSYQYQVSAYDSVGNESNPSTAIIVNTPAEPDTEPPTTPTGLSATVVSATRVDLSWSASSDDVAVTGYWIIRDGTTIDSSSTTSYSDTTVLPNTTYSYRVAAFDTAGNTSDLSNTATVTTPDLPDEEPPTAPSNLRTTSVAHNQVNLAWDASTDNIGVVKYNIIRDGVEIAEVSGTTTTFGDSIVSPSTTYTYRLTAEDSAGNTSNPSNEITVTTLAEPDTEPPTVNITSPTTGETVSDTITVTVSASDNIAVAKVELLVDDVVVGEDTTEPYSFELDTTVYPNGTHTLQAVAYDTRIPDSNVGFSPPVSITINNDVEDTEPPTAPGDLRVTGLTHAQVNLEWDASTDNIGVVGYRILRNDAVLATLGGLTTSYGDSSVLPNTTYRYEVLAFDAAGNESASSNEVEVTTLSPPDTERPSVDITAPADGSTVSGTVLIQATASDNVAVARVEFRIDGSLKKRDTSVPYNYSWDTAAASNGDHTISAKAYDSAGNTATDTITVNVFNVGEPLPPTVDIKANGSNGPIKIHYNIAATLSWTSTDATACTASGAWSGSKGTSGSASTGALTSSKTYTLACTGLGGSASDSVRVNVGKKADLNLDGRVNIFDLSILLTRWKTTNKIADINNSGRVDIFDLSILLSRWGR